MWVCGLTERSPGIDTLVRLVGDDEKQGLSWFAFECVTAQLAKELKIV